MYSQHNLKLSTYCNKIMDKRIMPIGTIYFNFTAYIDCYTLSTVLVYNIFDEYKARNSEGLKVTSIVKSFVVKANNLVLVCKEFLVIHYLKGNKGAKMYIGNKKSIDILHQNLPGVTMSKEQIHYNLEIILTKRQPDVLILSEVGPSVIDEMNFENYELIVGNISLEVKECRVSALISQNLR